MVQAADESGATVETDETSTSGKSFAQILGAMAGHMVTIVNAESYEHAPVGYQLKAGFYKAKVAELGTDYVAVITEMKRGGKEAANERVKQFIPFSHIKRLSAMKSENILHI